MSSFEDALLNGNGGVQQPPQSFEDALLRGDDRPWNELDEDDRIEISSDAMAAHIKRGGYDTGLKGFAGDVMTGMTGATLGVGQLVTTPHDYFFGTNYSEQSARSKKILELGSSKAQDDSLIGRYTRGITESVGTALTGRGLGKLAGAKSVTAPMIATQGAVTGLEKRAEAGLQGKTQGEQIRAGAIGFAIEAGVTGAFQKAFPGVGLESVIGQGFSREVAKEATKSFGKHAVAEVTEESIIHITQALADHMQSMGPEVTVDRLRKELPHVAAQTVITLGLFRGAQGIAHRQATSKEQADGELNPATFVLKHPEEAKAIAEIETPTRKQWTELGLSPAKGKNKAARRAFADQIRQELPFHQATQQPQAQPPVEQQMAEALGAEPIQTTATEESADALSSKAVSGGRSSRGRGNPRAAYIHGTGVRFEKFRSEFDDGRNLAGPGVYLVEAGDRDVAEHYAKRALNRALGVFKPHTRQRLMETNVGDQAEMDFLLGELDKAQAVDTKFPKERWDQARELLESLRQGDLGKLQLDVEFNPRKMIDLGVGAYRNPRATTGELKGGRRLDQDERQTLLNALPPDQQSKLAEVHAGHDLYNAIAKEVGYESLNKHLLSNGYDAIYFTHPAGGFAHDYSVTVALDPEATQILSPAQPNQDIAQLGTDDMVFASDLVNREADVREHLETGNTRGFIGAGPGLRNRAETTMITPASVEPEFEKRFRAAKGAKRDSTWERVKQAGKDAWSFGTRAQRHIPNNEEFAVANESFRLLKEVGDAAQDTAVRDIAAVIDPMSDAELDLFTRKIVLENLKDTQDLSRRFGSTPGQIATDLANVDEVIATRPNIQKALENRRAKREKLLNELVDNGLLNESVLNDPDSYFHRQVVNYMQDEQIRSGALGSLAKKSFQKRRLDAKGADLGAEYDFNTDFIQSEFEWMADARTQLLKTRIFKDLMRNYDKTSELQAEAKATGKSVADLAKEKGLVAWRPTATNAFVEGMSIIDASHRESMHKLRDELVEKYDLNEEQAQELDTVFGAKTYHIPPELARQLRTAKNKDAHVIEKVSKGIMRRWKVFTLLNPKRFLGYSARNLLGDLDGALAANPGVLRHLGPAIGMARDFYSNKKHLPEAVKAANRLGIMNSSLTSAEMSKVNDLDIFRGFNEKESNAETRNALKRFAVKGSLLPYHVGKAWFDFAGKTNEVRESVGRLAAFIYYRKQLTDGTLKTYGASKKPVVDAIRRNLGVDEAAAHLARNLFGDYRNLTELGDLARSHVIPFYSWTEVNFKKWKQIPRNVASSKDPAQAAALATLSLAGMYGMIGLWNTYGFPFMFGSDDEKLLNRAEKARPHILLGKSPDGSTIILRNVGSLGDFLEWFGVWTLLGQTEQTTPTEAVKTVGKDLANKLGQGVRPIAKTTLETAMGQSLYPDASNPRRRPRDEIAADFLGLSDELRAIKGKVEGGGYRARRGYWSKYLGGATDVKLNSYYEILGLRDKFLQKKEGASFLPNPYFRNMREAALADDHAAFVEAKKGYLKDRSVSHFKQAIKQLNPLARIPELKRKEFVDEYLNASQREKLTVAQDFAVTLRGAMVRHWTMK